MARPPLDRSRQAMGWPGLPIVVLTGFIDDLPEEVIRAAGVREILRKPATTGELAPALNQVLEVRAEG